MMTPNEKTTSGDTSGEHTSLIIISKVGDVEKGKHTVLGIRSGVWYAIIVIFVLVAAAVVTTLLVTGDGDDNDDDGGDNETEHVELLDPLDLCSAESILKASSAIACHDPTGCGKAGDKTDRCFVSDLEQPVRWAIANDFSLSNIDRNSSLGRAGEVLSNLPATCVVNACENRRCLCTDNGNGSSHCEGIKLVDFPFTNIAEGDYHNCETSAPQLGENTLVFAGKATNCACQDVVGCNAYNGKSPSWITHDDRNVTKSFTDRCYASVHHDGALDQCVPGACGMIFPCDCVDHGDGTSACPTKLPFRDVEDVPNCESITLPPSPLPVLLSPP